MCSFCFCLSQRKQAMQTPNFLNSFESFTLKPEITQKQTEAQIKVF